MLHVLGADMFKDAWTIIIVKFHLARLQLSDLKVTTKVSKN